MNFKALTIGLAVATATTFAMAKPVAYQIDPYTYSNSFHMESLWFFNAICKLQRHSGCD